jgi:hypothetical protein
MVFRCKGNTFFDFLPKEWCGKIKIPTSVLTPYQIIPYYQTPQKQVWKTALRQVSELRGNSAKVQEKHSISG